MVIGCATSMAGAWKAQMHTHDIACGIGLGGGLELHCMCEYDEMAWWISI